MQLYQNSFSVVQQQKLLITTAMKQALLVMQLPLAELAEWMEEQIAHNPVLEVQEPAQAATRFFSKGQQKPKDPLLEHLCAASPSLFDHLMAQARFHFHTEKELHLAEWIIGHFDDRGFLSEPEELNENPQETQRILAIIQTFDPPGIGAKDTRDSLLIQLKLKQKEHTLAYQIIAKHFEDLLQNRRCALAKKFHISLEQLSLIIQHDIASLQLHPAERFRPHHVETIIPDLYLTCLDDVWSVEANHAYIPAFRLASTYHEAAQHGQLSSQDQHYLRKHLTAGKWLRHIVEKRKQTLIHLGKFLLRRQADFFQGGTLLPLKLAEAAQALGLHESTIARAVANKYLACPQGLFALKDFFHHAVQSREGKVSHHLLRKKLKELVAAEDKKKPYSDAAIQGELHKAGFLCARRTVSKYRRLLHIASAAKRRR